MTETNNFINVFNTHITSVISLIFVSLLIRSAVILSGQNWIRTYAHTITMILLPVITYTITAVIAGNIALSLGMVGALSIVRFRNPVKSPYELALYFLFITLGISASVSLSWMWFLACASLTVMLTINLIDHLYFKAQKTSLFKASFSEGNALHVLEADFQQPIEQLEKNPYLVAVVIEPGSAHYRFAHSVADPLLGLMNEIRAQAPSARLSYVAP